MQKKVYQQIKRWLQTCVILTFLIILLGGATRLTGSGLSMASIKVFAGVVPPMSRSAWLESFQDYQKTLEYKKSYPQGMLLEDYKRIFLLEYLHRLFARVLAGLVFFLPFVYFVWRYYFVSYVLSSGFVLRLLALFALGALQGFLGWMMVKSGMHEETALIADSLVRVSPYRLAVHLLMALLILSALLALIFECSRKSGYELYVGKSSALLKGLFVLLGLSVSLTVIFGAFVAGTYAGLAYQTFPLMNGVFVPKDLHVWQPWFLSFFEHMATVQFYHRLGAYVSFGVALALFLLRKRLIANPRMHRFLRNLFWLVFAQGFFGVATLLHFRLYQTMTVVLALFHQLGAVLLFGVIVWGALCVFWNSGKRKGESVYAMS